MAAPFRLEIVTPDGLAFAGDVNGLIAPAHEGYLGVLAKHAPMVCLLTPGKLRVQADGRTTTYEVREGFLEVTRDKTLVLVQELRKK